MPPMPPMPEPPPPAQVPASRHTDFGYAHQGPLLVIGERMVVLYFTEFLTSPTGLEKAQVNSRRSMLQLGEVKFRDGWLSCNRSEPLDVVLLPPADANPSKKTTATPTHIAEAEATVIALAEMNRWHGAWFVREASAPHDGGARIRGVYRGIRLASGYYRELHASTPESCVAICKAEPASATCGGMSFKEPSIPGGLGPNCSKPGYGCCYLMTTAAVGPVPQSNCPPPCVGWDSWAAVGIVNGTQPSKYVCLSHTGHK